LQQLSSLKETIREIINSNKTQNSPKSKIACTDNSCHGVYFGPEFIDGADIAHQFSNKMAAKVGDKLKELYDKDEFSSVDFFNISMSTDGMGSGTVVYELKIPFIRVNQKCDAYTSFDHVGGWNHTPDLAKRKEELKDVLLAGEVLAISSLKTTPEGLQEFWIQWKNKTKQAGCE